MEECRYGRGRLHDFGQPAVGRKLGGLEHRRERQQARRCDRKAAPHSCARGSLDRCNIGCAVGRYEQCGRTEERAIPETGSDELLACRALRRHAVGVEQQEPLQKKAGGDPGDRQLDDIPSGHQQQHRGERHAEPAGEGTLPGLAIEIGPGIADDDPADEADQNQHHGADCVQPDRQSDAVKPDHGTDAGSINNQSGQRDERHDQCQE